MTGPSLHGIGVSAGIAVGPLVAATSAPTAPANEPTPTDPAQALASVKQALNQVAETLQSRADAATGQAKEILQAGAMMAQDPSLVLGVETRLNNGMGPANAIAGTVAEYSEMFLAAGGYLAERVTDLKDVGDRAIAHLLGLPEPGVPHFSVPSVLVARDLAPAETATLTPQTCLAIVTEAGGPTSHTAILAAQLGIPAVVQVSGVLQLPIGTVLAVDGGAGEVQADPSADRLAELTQRQQRREQALSTGTGPGATSDGHAVALLANIGTVADAHRAAAQAVEGVGLFRTEFLFLERETMPTLEEQTATYTEVFQAFGDRRVVVRTLDAGADKPLKFADLGPEENPALGRRGLRLGMIRTEVLDVQLAAIAAAHRASGADVRVMAPMVATPDEAAWFAKRVRDLGLPKVGVMIEIPAAALRSATVLAEVDFGSLGTNDLAQYTMAADRMQGELATLLDPWEPAVLEVIAQACAGAAAAGRPIGVCGEAGGDPGLALVLVGLGVSSLSMAPSKVAAVRTALAAHTLASCRALAAVARSARGPAEAKAAVLDAADPILADLA